MSVTNEEISCFYENQLSAWELLRENTEVLRSIQHKEIIFNECRIHVQLNAERKRSTFAQTDKKSIEKRSCFLCGQNRPIEQDNLFLANDFYLLCNPYPIFPYHFTITHKQHVIQEINQYLPVLIELSELLENFVVFYNGPEAGASAPDHMHFQAAPNQNFIAFDECKNLRTKENSVFQSGTISIYAIQKNDFLRNCMLFISHNKSALILWLEKTILLLKKETNAKAEPLLNIEIRKIGDEFQVLLFARDRLRPSCFFETGENQIAVSPASVEMSGTIIVARQSDFDKLTPSIVRDIFMEVSLSQNIFESLKTSLAK